MRYILPLIGIVGSFFMIRYRQQIGDMVGEADWMRKIGGVYTVIFLCGVLLFFWCIAELTGTTTILFKPLLYLIPGARPGSTSF